MFRQNFNRFLSNLEFSMNIRNPAINHIPQSKSEEYICQNNSKNNEKVLNYPVSIGLYRLLHSSATHGEGGILWRENYT